MKQEDWKKIPGLEPYEASSLGRIKGPRRILRPQFSKDGYHRVEISIKGNKRKWFVSHLVLMTFSGPRPENMWTAHLNNNRTDNRIDNIIWATMKENASHKYLHGTVARGESHTGAKLTNRQVFKIRELYPLKKEAYLAKKFGISRSVVYLIVRGRAWTHLLPKAEEKPGQRA